MTLDLVGSVFCSLDLVIPPGTLKFGWKLRLLLLLVWLVGFLLCLFLISCFLFLRSLNILSLCPWLRRWSEFRLPFRWSELDLLLYFCVALVSPLLVLLTPFFLNLFARFFSFLLPFVWLLRTLRLGKFVLVLSSNPLSITDDGDFEVLNPREQADNRYQNNQNIGLTYDSKPTIQPSSNTASEISRPENQDIGNVNINPISQTYGVPVSDPLGPTSSQSSLTQQNSQSNLGKAFS